MKNNVLFFQTVQKNGSSTEKYNQVISFRQSIKTLGHLITKSGKVDLYTKY